MRQRSGRVIFEGGLAVSGGCEGTAASQFETIVVYSM